MHLQPCILNNVSNFSFVSKQRSKFFVKQKQQISGRGLAALVVITDMTGVGGDEYYSRKEIGRAI